MWWAVSIEAWGTKSTKERNSCVLALLTDMQKNHTQDSILQKTDAEIGLGNKHQHIQFSRVYGHFFQFEYEHYGHYRKKSTFLLKPVTVNNYTAVQ